MDTIGTSALNTGKVIVVDNAWMNCGAGSEIITKLVERDDVLRDVKFHRMGFSFVPCPTTPSLEEHFYPNAKKIALKSYEMIYPNKEPWFPSSEIKIEEIEFKGPF
jgi:pyruvate dehydrogenase E1 component beta subunit